LKGGARLISTNPDHNVDASVDGSHRVLPGGGALVAPFAVATGVAPVTIGKPQSLLFEMAMSRLGTSAGECLMVGDRPDTDIAGAAALGMCTALVRTGRFAPGDPWPDKLPMPDWDVPTLSHLLDELYVAFPGWLD
ncbi:MAG: HAD hydrolase-like protein, partial [Sedimenticola sp.]